MHYYSAFYILCLRKQTMIRINRVAKFWGQQQHMQRNLVGCQQKELQSLQIQGKVFYLPIVASGCKWSSCDIRQGPSTLTVAICVFYYITRFEDSVKGWSVSITDGGKQHLPPLIFWSIIPREQAHPCFIYYFSTEKHQHFWVNWQLPQSQNTLNSDCHPILWSVCCIHPTSARQKQWIKLVFSLFTQVCTDATMTVQSTIIKTPK